MKSGAKPTTLSRRLAAIRYAHSWPAILRLPIPKPSRLLCGALTHRQALPNEQGAGYFREASRNGRSSRRWTRGLRDRALLLLGFAGAFRRSELIALNLEDFVFATTGLLVTIRKSKTDQEGDGATIAIARTPLVEVLRFSK